MPPIPSTNDAPFFDLVEPVENPRRPRYKCKICPNKPEIYASTLNGHIRLTTHQSRLDPALRLPVVNTYSNKGSKTSPILVELDVELERKKKEAAEAKKREENRANIAKLTAEGLRRKRTATQAGRGYAVCVEKAEEMAKAHVEKRGDPAHDYGHVNRVRFTALRIAKSLQADGTAVDLKLVELTAIFHDIATKDTTAISLRSTLDPFLTHPSTALALSWEQKLKLVDILPAVSFAAETALRENQQWSADFEECDELHIVQDAEKLDSMGLMGLTRFLLSSEVRVRLASGHQGEEGEKETVDEIFMARSRQLLKDALKTEAGKEEAESYEPSLKVWRAEIQKANERGRGRQVSPD